MKTLGRILGRTRRLIDRDARQVGELQRALLPDPLPRIPGLEIAVSYEPSGRAGGDLYDFFPLDNTESPTRWCLFIGDASGHGCAAALVISIVQCMLHAHPPHITGPADLLNHINRHLCAKSFLGFVTAFVGIYDSRELHFSYACAGHPAPIIRTAPDGNLSRLNAVLDFPLGIEEQHVFEEATAEFRRGDTVLLYTDGIIEARGARREMFGEERIERDVRESRGGPVDLIQRLRRSVGSHQRGYSQRDDQSMVAIRFV